MKHIFEDYIDNIETDEVVTGSPEATDDSEDMTACLRIRVAQAHHGLYYDFCRALDIMVWFSEHCPFIGNHDVIVRMGSPKDGLFEFHYNRDGRNEIRSQYKKKFQRDLLPFELYIEFAPEFVRFDIFFAWLKRFGMAIARFKNLSPYVYVQSSFDSEGNQKFPDLKKYRFSWLVAAEAFFNKVDIWNMYANLFDSPVTVEQKEIDYLNDKYSGMRFRHQDYDFIEMLFAMKRYPDLFTGYEVRVDGWRKVRDGGGWNIQVFMSVDKKSVYMSIQDKMNFIERKFVNKFDEKDIQTLATKDELIIYLVCSDEEIDEIREKTPDTGFYKVCSLHSKNMDTANITIVVVNETLVPVVDQFKKVSQFRPDGAIIGMLDYEIVKRYFDGNYKKWLDNEG